MKTVDEAAMAANFAAIKGSVQCYDVAEPETFLRPSGKDLRGGCPLPEHEGDSPSFYCYDNGQGFYDKWYCHRCSKGGDVIDLYAAMHGFEHSPVFALQELASHHGIKLQKGDDFLSDNQLLIRRTKKRAMARLESAITKLMFEQYVLPWLKAIEDPEERERQLQSCLKEAGLVSKQVERHGRVVEVS